MIIQAYEEDTKGRVTRVQAADNKRWFDMPEGMNVTQEELGKLTVRRENGAVIISGTVKRKQIQPPVVVQDPPGIFDGTIEDPVPDSPPPPPHEPTPDPEVIP